MLSVKVPVANDEAVRIKLHNNFLGQVASLGIIQIFRSVLHKSLATGIAEGSFRRIVGTNGADEKNSAFFLDACQFFLHLFNASVHLRYKLLSPFRLAHHLGKLQDGILNLLHIGRSLVNVNGHPHIPQGLVAFGREEVRNKHQVRIQTQHTFRRTTMSAIGNVLHPLHDIRNSPIICQIGNAQDSLHRYQIQKNLVRPDGHGHNPLRLAGKIHLLAGNIRNAVTTAFLLHSSTFLFTTASAK